MEIGKSVRRSVDESVYNSVSSVICWSILLSSSSSVLNLVRGSSRISTVDSVSVVDSVTNTISSSSLNPIKYGNR